MTPRQLQVLKLSAHGWNSKQAAHKLGIAVETVKRHKKDMFLKIGATNIANLIYLAMKDNLIS